MKHLAALLISVKPTSITYRVRVTGGFYQLGVASSGLRMRPGSDAAEQRWERDAEQPGHRRQLSLAFGHHFAGTVVHEIDVAQEQHCGQNPHYIHEWDAQKTCSRKTIGITLIILQ